MQTLVPLNHLTEDQRRKRLMQSGEVVTFDLAFVDNAPSPTAAHSRPVARPDAGRMIHDAICLATGRISIAPSQNAQAIADQVAQEAAQKRAINDAVVATQVAMIRDRASSVPKTDQRLLDAGKAARDAALAARYR